YLILCDFTEPTCKQLEQLLPETQLSEYQTENQQLSEDYISLAKLCFNQIKSALTQKGSEKILLQIIIPSGPRADIFAGLAGLLKTSSLENSQLKAQLIFLDNAVSAEEIRNRLLHEEKHSESGVVKYENGTRNTLRWKAKEAPLFVPHITFKDNGVYIITGGLGSLGLLFAKEILQNTRLAKVIVTGRSGLTSKKKLVLSELSLYGDRVEYEQLDLSNIERVTSLVKSIQRKHKQLNGVIHSAGMIRDNFIFKKSLTEFEKVLEPKVRGTFNLDSACAKVKLDFFVLFSSGVAVFGNPGQVDYAAANGFMNHFSEYRNQLKKQNLRFGHTLSINWPLWRDGGMSIEPNAQQKLQETSGMHPMESTTGIEMFYRSLGSLSSQTIVVEGNVPKIEKQLFTKSEQEVKQSPEVFESEYSDLDVENNAAEIASLKDTDRSRILEKFETYLRKAFSSQLKMPASQIASKAPLENYGIDSILALKLTELLEKTFGALPKTLFFEYQTIEALADYLFDSFSEKVLQLFSLETSSKSVNKPEKTGQGKSIEAKVISSVSPVNERSRRHLNRFRKSPQTLAASSTLKEVNTASIAIVGLSGRYPESSDIKEYWSNLKEGKDCVIEIPKERWDWQEYYNQDRTTQGNHFSKWGGFIEGVDEFDPLFFNVSPREAELIDPQERLFLQHAWMAIEDAGYTRDSLQIAEQNDLAGQVGVYVGVMYGEYQLFGAESSIRGQRTAFAGNLASIANRVSYVLNIHGPSMTLDTMCSSSLTSIHLACQDLKLGRTSMAIA
ncbi:MAG: SDR family NAD(P)-dependent oxidoreductase, partial [Kangiellaceae bacterium]|nr:SDR family NAD(P)-dependent oxidoreductase [Kangiellaceae bacterium]